MLSIVTLVRNRNRMLRGLLASCAVQTVGAPNMEVVVVHAGGDEDPHDVLGDFPGLRTSVQTLDRDDEQIPYSTARNAGAAGATGAMLLFADADTVLAPTAVARLTSTLRCVDALCTGSLAYLPPQHPDPGRVPFDRLRRRARSHPSRPSSPAIGHRFGDDHDSVWGLNMAMRRATFDSVGGFDETYHGYAGEDTDLGRSLRAAGVPTAYVAGAGVLHQHHDSFEPPLHQFRATVANACRFHEKWGEWPMTGWLARFAAMGLVEFDGTSLRVLRDPTPAEVAAARRTSAVPFRRTERQDRSVS